MKSVKKLGVGGTKKWMERKIDERERNCGYKLQAQLKKNAGMHFPHFIIRYVALFMDKHCS